jgi:hypothetical protein
MLLKQQSNLEKEFLDSLFFKISQHLAFSQSSFAQKSKITLPQKDSFDFLEQ